MQRLDRSAHVFAPASLRRSFLPLLAAVTIALLPGPGRAADDIEPAPTSDLLAASYDVIIVPRPGGRAPRVLTDRGWRSLSPRPQQREAGNYQRRFYGDRWTGRVWRPPSTAYGRLPYDARADWQNRPLQAWRSPTWRQPWPDGWRRDRQSGWPTGGYARAN